MRDISRDEDELHSQAMDLPDDVKQTIRQTTSGIVTSAVISLRSSDTPGIVLRKHAVGLPAGVDPTSVGKHMQLIFNETFFLHLNQLTLIQVMWLVASGQHKRAQIVSLVMREITRNVYKVGSGNVAIALNKDKVMSNIRLIEVAAAILISVDGKMETPLV